MADDTEIKGGSTNMHHTRVVLVSNLPPHHWYDTSNYRVGGIQEFEETPFYRRITCMVEFCYDSYEQRYYRVWHKGEDHVFPIHFTKPGPTGLPPRSDEDERGNIILNRPPKKTKPNSE